MISSPLPHVCTFLTIPQQKRANIGHLAAGSIASLSRYDFIIINPGMWDSDANFNVPIKDGAGNYYNSSTSRTNALVHEGGHNSTDLGHKSKESNGTPYTYDKTGLQNNTNNNTYPTLQNTKTILNNEKNRETIEEPAGSNN